MNGELTIKDIIPVSFPIPKNSIPNSIYFEKKESFSNLNNLMNKLPDIKNLLNELDKTKYFLESKNITFKENFNNLFSFFYKLRSIGANVNTENKKKV